MLRLRVLLTLAAVLALLAATGRVTADETAKAKESKQQKKANRPDAPDPFAPATPTKEGKPERKASKPQEVPRHGASRGPTGAPLSFPHASVSGRTGAAAVEKALDVRVALAVEEVPLADVVDYLRSHADVAIILDEKSLQDVGISGDTPVTASLPSMPLRSVLNLMLRNLSLTWMIRDGVLLITTPEKADETLTTTVLDVSDLVVCRDRHDALWDDYDPLIDAITSTVLPTSWEDVGGAGSVRGASFGGAKVLVVAQTPQGHEEIAKLLAGIREIAKKTPNAPPPRRDRHPPKDARVPYGALANGCAPPTAKPAGQPATEKKPDTPPCRGHHPPCTF